jgi:hypothetical protein
LAISWLMGFGNNLKLSCDVQKELSFIAPLILLLMPIPFFRHKKLHSRYHHYAGVIVDVYDHFLAKNWVTYSMNLSDFVTAFYESLSENTPIL